MGIQIMSIVRRALHQRRRITVSAALLVATAVAIVTNYPSEAYSYKGNVVPPTGYSLFRKTESAVQP